MSAQFQETSKLYDRVIRALNTGQHTEGLYMLDELISHYHQNNQVTNIVKMLEQFVMQYPSEVQLRERLVSLYDHLGNALAANRQRNVIRMLNNIGITQSDTL